MDKNNRSVLEKELLTGILLGESYAKVCSRLGLSKKRLRAVLEKHRAFLFLAKGVFLEGKSLTAVAKEFGVSKQYASRIMRQYPEALATVRTHSERLEQERTAKSRLATLLEYLQLRKRLGRRPRLKEFSSPNEVLRSWGTLRELLAAAEGTPTKVKHSEEEIIKVFSMARKRLGRTPRLIDMREFGIHAYEFERYWGSWNNFLSTQGVFLLRHTDEKTARRDLLRSLLRVEERLGRIPSIRELTSLGEYGYTTYRLYWPDYSSVLEDAATLKATTT